MGLRKGDFPNAEMLSKNNLAIPIFPEMKDEEITYVVNNIKSFFKNKI